jgi:hypothetical protein
LTTHENTGYFKPYFFSGTAGSLDCPETVEPENNNIAKMGMY